MERMLRIDAWPGQRIAFAAGMVVVVAIATIAIPAVRRVVGERDFVICVNSQVSGISYGGVNADYMVVSSAALALIADGKL